MTGAYAPLVSKFSTPSFIILELNNPKELSVYSYSLIDNKVDIEISKIKL